jgi:hypothetical protein
VIHAVRPSAVSTPSPSTGAEPSPNVTGPVVERRHREGESARRDLPHRASAPGGRSAAVVPSSGQRSLKPTSLRVARLSLTFVSASPLAEPAVQAGGSVDTRAPRLPGRSAVGAFPQAAGEGADVQRRGGEWVDHQPECRPREQEGPTGSAIHALVCPAARDRVDGRRSDRIDRRRGGCAVQPVPSPSSNLLQPARDAVTSRGSQKEAPCPTTSTSRSS